MNFNEIESKLINLALCQSAHEGEFANAATMLFRQLRKRGVTAQQFSQNGQSAGFGTGDISYLQMLLRTERQNTQTLRERIGRFEVENLELSRTNFQQKAEIDKLRADIAAGVAVGVNFRAARNTTTSHAKAKGRYFGGILLTEIEREMFVRIATYYGAEGTNVSVGGICKNNREQGSIQGLIKKGLIEKRYSASSRKRLGLTEAGLAHFREYHINN